VTGATDRVCLVDGEVQMEVQYSKAMYCGDLYTQGIEGRQRIGKSQVSSEAGGEVSCSGTAGGASMKEGRERERREEDDGDDDDR
jgi:hypothetical protein